MPIISFTEQDLLRGKPLDPAWYVVRVDNIGEGPSKDGGSTNYPVEGTIIKDADTGDEKFAGYPLNWNFNSKAMGAARGFLECFNVQVTVKTRYDLASAEGKLLEVYVENGEWQGRIVNRVNHKYRPHKG